MIRKSADNENVTYLQLLRWRLVWNRGAFIGAYKFAGNTDAILYNETEWATIPFFRKVAYIFN